VPESPEPLPAPFSDTPELQTTASEPPPVSDSDLIRDVLSELPVCQSFSRETIWSVLIKHCGKRAQEIGKLLFAAHLLRLGDTDQFIHRDNDKRPNGYKGLIDPNGDGVIFAEPLPAAFCDDAETTASPEPQTAKAVKVMPKPENLSPKDEKLISCVVRRLKRDWSERKIPYAVIQETINTICGKGNANRIERLLIPEKLVQIGKTDLYVFREDKHRPLLYRGLNESAGIIEEIPALF